MDKITESRVRRVSKKRRKKWTIRIVSVIAVLLVGFIAYYGWNIASALNGSYDNVSGSKMRAKPVQPRTEPFAILLIGSDATNVDDHTHGENSTYGWRSDVLMVLAINPKTKTAKLVSIPRDTYVKIAHTHVATKITNTTGNTPPGMDKVRNVMDTVENFTGIPIDYYAKVNFQGFVDVVNAVGGVNVDVTLHFTGPAIGRYITFNVGKNQHFDGMHALAYVRQRHGIVGGDIARNQRQQDVINSIMDKMMSADGVANFLGVVKAVGKNFSYNIPMGDLASIIALYKEIPKQNIERIEVQTTGGPQVRGMDVQYCSPQEQQRISTILRTELDWHGPPAVSVPKASSTTTHTTTKKP